VYGAIKPSLAKSTKMMDKSTSPSPIKKIYCVLNLEWLLQGDCITLLIWQTLYKKALHKNCRAFIFLFYFLVFHFNNLVRVLSVVLDRLKIGIIIHQVSYVAGLYLLTTIW
jgi:hypothetical protein